MLLPLQRALISQSLNTGTCQAQNCILLNLLKSTCFRVIGAFLVHLDHIADPWHEPIIHPCTLIPVDRLGTLYDHRSPEGAYECPKPVQVSHQLRILPSQCLARQLATADEIQLDARARGTQIMPRCGRHVTCQACLGDLT